MISLTTQDSRARSQWGRYNLPIYIYIHIFHLTLWPPHHCWPNYNLWFLILLKPPNSISMSLYVCTTCERLKVGSCQIKLDFLCPKRALSVDHLTIILLPLYPIYIFYIYILLQLLIPHFEIFLASKCPLAIIMAIGNPPIDCYLDWTIIGYKWWMFDCHVWLPEGTPHIQSGIYWI
jgi:hypothetical protein